MIGIFATILKLAKDELERLPNLLVVAPVPILSLVPFKIFTSGSITVAKSSIL